MGTNVVNTFLDRHYDFASWKEYDPLLYRLHSIHQLDVQFQNALWETPIFACKSAEKAGNEHFVSMANEDGQLQIMNTDSKEKFNVKAHDNAIFDLAWKFNEMQLVTASGDHTSKLYDFGDGGLTQVKLFYGHTRSVRTVAFRKDDCSVFATGSRDGNIILWDTRSDQNSFIGRPDCTIMNSHDSAPIKPRKRTTIIANNIGTKSVTGLVFQNSNTLISCGAGDGIIKIWDLRKHYTTYKKEPLPKHTIPYSGKTGKNGYSNLIIDKSGICLYANCLDNTIYCYNVATYNVEPIMTYSGHQNSTFYVKSSLCKDEKYLSSGSTDENAYIWNLKYSKPIVKLPGHTAEVTCVTWCNKGSFPRLMTCSDDMTYKIWNICGIDCCSDIEHKAEVLPVPVVKQPSRKRLCTLNSNHLSLKQFIPQCQNCQKATTSQCLCENCTPERSKRKAECELQSESKRLGTEFGPRRLFAHLDGNFEEGEAVKILENLDEEDGKEKNLSESLKTYSKEAIQTMSPTTNLPNFVIDGTAPHLNYSPPKRKSQDWLTKLRIERNLRQEMLERSMGPSSPKSPRLDLTPKSNRRSWVTPKSPLLRYFKVTSSNSSKNDVLSCSPKNHSCNYLPSTNLSNELS